MQNLTIALMMLVCFTLYLQSVDLRAVKRKQDLAACESDSECPEGYACNLDVKWCRQGFKRRDSSEEEDSSTSYSQDSSDSSPPKEEDSSTSDSQDSSGSSPPKDIDECATDNGNCEQICNNTAGSFVCDCEAGYALNADGSSCDDIDECTDNTDDCEQLCNNTVGCYECYCVAGYTLNADGSSCDDIDECALNTDDCEQLCNNTAGCYECYCVAGYTLNADGSSCDDVDECLLETDCCNGTSHNCSNTDGSYECSCDEGNWTLATDGCECIGPQEPCPAEWTLFSSSCYRRFEGPDFITDWFTAKGNCSDYGGYLVTISSVEENTFMESFTNGIDVDFWINVVDYFEEGNFTTYSGQPQEFLPDYIYGNSEEYDCGFIYDGRWYMEQCYSQFESFICEQPSNE